MPLVIFGYGQHADGNQVTHGFFLVPMKWSIRLTIPAASWCIGCSNTKKFRRRGESARRTPRDWQQRYPRLAQDMSQRPVDPAEEPVQSVELWDLVSAFGRILREHTTVPTSNIRYDDTPIHVYMSRIHALLRANGRVAFKELVQPGMHRSAMVGMFLAVLELVRNYRIVVEQENLFGDIGLVAG